MVKPDGKLQPTGWNEAFAAIKRAARGRRSGARSRSSSATWSTARPWCWCASWPSGWARRMSTAGRTGPSSRRPPRRLPVQHDHRRHRAGRRLPAGRHQPALGGAAHQRPAAQALAGRRLQGGADRRRPSADLPGRGCWVPGPTRWRRWPRRARFRRDAEAGEEPDADLGHGCARPGRWCAVLERGRARRAGLVKRRVERLQRAAHGGRPRRRARSRGGAGRGRARRRGHPGRCASRRDRGRVPDRCRRDRHRPARQARSWSIRATTAIAVRQPPT